MVPLALNLARRVDAEVRNDAAGQAHIVAAQAAGSMDNRAQLRRLARRAAADLGARVIVVDSSEAFCGPTPPAAQCARSRPGRRSAPRSAAARLRASGTATRSARTCSSRRCPVTNGGQIVGAVRVTQSVERRQRPRPPQRARPGRRSEPRRSRSGSCSRGSWPTRSRARCGGWRRRRGAWRKATSRRAPRSSGPSETAGGRARVQRHDRAARASSSPRSASSSPTRPTSCGRR